jgi:hypothetical protein
MSRRLALLLLVALAATVGAEEPPPTPPPESEPALPAPAPSWTASNTFTGELVAVGTISTLAELKLTGWEVRIGLGGRQGKAAPAALGLTSFDQATWLIIVGLSRTHTVTGLEVRGLRLGVGVRLQAGRFTLGADTHLAQLDVPRVSTSGTLSAAGAGIGLVISLDLVQFGERAAVMLFADVTGDLYGVSIFQTGGGGGDHNSQFGAHGGLALRW